LQLLAFYQVLLGLGRGRLRFTRTVCLLCHVPKVTWFATPTPTAFCSVRLDPQLLGVRDTQRAVSEKNVEVVRSIYEAWARR
jgi:hypothetical protein